MTTDTVRQLQKQPDPKQLQAMLSALPGNMDNSYESNNWCFRDNRQRLYTIPFNLIEKVLAPYPDWAQRQGLNSIPLVKKLFLSLAERTGITNYLKTFRSLLLWIAALAANNINNLERHALPKLLRFRLTHTISNGGVFEDRALSSYSSLTNLGLVRMKEVCDDLELNWFGRNITNHAIQRELKKLIPALTDGEITYRDWQNGKSFNLLTLDYGRYYVEHSLNVFEEQAPLALALHQTQLDGHQIAESAGIKPNTLNTILCRILEGYKAEDIHPRHPNYVRRIQTLVINHFRSVYRQTRLEHELLQEETLQEIAATFGLAPSAANIDRLRVIFWDWFRRGLRNETERLLCECKTPVSWDMFERTLESVKQRCDNAPISMPTPQFFAELGFEKKHHHGIANVNRFIAWVAKSGLTNIVALTGWRRSEFGFPSSAIQQSRNTDKLDEYAFPHRYQVDWYVHKTNGPVRSLREITFSTFTMIDRLRRLNDSGIDQPCLYSVTAENKDPSRSDNAVQAAVIRLWPHYVQHYPGFKLLDDLETWHALTKTKASQGLLTMTEHREREKLLSIRSAQEWDSLTVDENMRAAWRRARAEWPRMSFTWSKNSKTVRGWVLQYHRGALRQDWSDLLDSYLSEETREWLFSMSVEELAMNTEVGRTISNEILTDVLYPSPHAFRHMWAESVYRRFDGDAGWIIRSQFKHISRRMWLSYIRDKDNRLVHQSAKLQVTHSLVANFLSHRGEGYAGQMTTLLRRLFHKTKILTPEEQKELAAELATKEIENLKSNPWGYCLLMRRSRHKARCAQGGEPMRHNASPELCLGCRHNLMQTGNVEWMVFHVMSHVDALNNPLVPEIFKKSSYNLVRDTARHLRKLAPDHEALPELETTLASYQRAA